MALNILGFSRKVNIMENENRYEQNSGRNGGVYKP